MTRDAPVIPQHGAAQVAGLPLTQRRITNVFFVNGVLNTYHAATTSFLEFITAITTPPSPWSMSSGAYTYYKRVYNPTYSAITNPDARCVVANAHSPSALLAKCPSHLIPFADVLYDLIQAATQVGVLAAMQYSSVPPIASPVALSLRGQIEAALDSGRAVLLVGHSQGNLVIDEALAGIQRFERVGHLRVAAPIRLASPLDALSQRSGFIAKGALSQDALLYLPGPKDPSVRTDVTTASDVLMAAAALSQLPWLLSVTGVGTGLYAHVFSSYAGDPAVAPLMRDQLTGLDDRVSRQCDSHAPGIDALLALADAECRLTYNLGNAVISHDLSLALSQLIAEKRRTGAVSALRLADAQKALAQARRVLGASGAADLDAIALALIAASSP